MATGQSRFTRRYTDQQKNAFLHAVIVDKQPITRVVDMAHKGELPGVPAFPINRVYAYELVAKNRDSYERENPDALTQAIDDTIARLAAKALRLARNTLKDDNATPQDIARALATLKQAQTATAKAAPTKPTAPVQTNPNQPENKAPDVVGQLLGKTSTQQSETARGPVRSLAR